MFATPMFLMRRFKFVERKRWLPFTDCLSHQNVSHVSATSLFLCKRFVESRNVGSHSPAGGAIPKFNTFLLCCLFDTFLHRSVGLCDLLWSVCLSVCLSVSLSLCLSVCLPSPQSPAQRPVCRSAQPMANPIATLDAVRLRLLVSGWHWQCTSVCMSLKSWLP